MKYIFFLFLLCFALSNVKGQQTSPSFTLAGVLKGAANKKVYLMDDIAAERRSFKDSTTADSNGNFKFKRKLKEPTPVYLAVQGLPLATQFYIENSTMRLSGHVDSLQSVRVTGSKEQVIREGLIKVLNDSLDAERIINLVLAAQDSKDSLSLVKTTAEYYKMLVHKHLMLKRFIINNSSSAAALDAVSVLVSEQQLKLADSLLSFIEKGTSVQPMRKQAIRASISKQIAKDAYLPIGSVAPSFKQADANGHLVSLQQFRGKYVLIDFWASWCGPCRKESPELVKAYKRFSTKGFTILSISLDDKKSSWLEAVKTDNLSWTHLSDLKGWKNEVAKLYMISAVPASFLVDPQGVIVARDLRGDDLYKKLETLFKTGTK